MMGAIRNAPMGQTATSQHAFPTTDRNPDLEALLAENSIWRLWVLGTDCHARTPWASAGALGRCSVRISDPRPSGVVGQIDNEAAA